MTAVTAVAWARVVGVSGVAAIGSFFEDISSDAELFFVIVGLVWVPWSVVVLFASERPDARLAVDGGPLGDLVILLASQLLVPSAAEAALVGELVVIAFAAHSGGRRLASGLALAALTGTMAIRVVDGDDHHVEPALLLMFAATAVAIVLLLDRAAYLRDRANAAVARLQSSSDAVLARVADAVVVTDSAGTITSANAAVERLVSTRTPLVGARCEDVLGLRIDERRLDCSDGCALVGLGDDGMGVEVWRSCDERRQPLLANVAPVTDDEGVVVEVVHSLRDITKIKQTEEAKTLFLATASHELKTPLTVIRGFVETMQGGALDSERQGVALAAIHRRTLELGEIVDRLLLSSRIEAGHIDLMVGEVALAPLIEERAGAMAAARGRTVRATIDPDVQSVRGDATAIATVIDHLVDNAVSTRPTAVTSPSARSRATR